MVSAPLVPFRLTICGLDELTGHCDVGVSHVLSILDPGYPAPEAFGVYGAHERLDLRFHDIIDDRPGWKPPQQHHVEALLEFGRAHRPSHLLVHCHAGISRSTASMLLLLAQALPDIDAEALMAEIARIRPQAWPNLRIAELGDDLLGRAGSIVAAVRARHAVVAAERPDFVRQIALAGRERELVGLI